MKAIILAAGTGSRLMPLTKDVPKPLVKIGEGCLIDHVISSLTNSGIHEVVIVGGYRFQQLRDHLEKSRDEASLTIIENPSFHTGNINSLFAAEDHLRGDLVIMNADHLYPITLMRTFLTFCGKNIAIACDFDRSLGDEDMKVLLLEDPDQKAGDGSPGLEGNGARGQDRSGDTDHERKEVHGKERSGVLGEETNGVIRQEGWGVGSEDGGGLLRDISKNLGSFHGGYIGMTFIPGKKIPGYLAALKGTRASYGEEAVVEDVLRTLAGTNIPPRVVDLSGLGWMEIDTPHDLEAARKCLVSEEWTGFWEDR